MKITPSERVDWPPPYKDATEKYSSQVRLSQDRRSVVGYVAGQPFPLIDANDPDVAVKVIDLCGFEHWFCAEDWAEEQELHERIMVMLDVAIDPSAPAMDW